jgi:hypothetical protein
MTSPQAYPLQWPEGWPRTWAGARKAGPYRTELPAALRNLRAELKLLCGEAAARTLVLSSNVTLGAEAPADPGVVAYFTWEGEATAIPCDRWAKVAHNVQAIALTIEAMRSIERHGAKHMVKAMFRGFTALPAPTPAEDWRAVLGDHGTLAGAEMVYRAQARTAHPDAPGGSHAAMARLNAAVEAARRHFGQAP